MEELYEYIDQLANKSSKKRDRKNAMFTDRLFESGRVSALLEVQKKILEIREREQKETK